MFLVASSRRLARGWRLAEVIEDRSSLIGGVDLQERVPALGGLARAFAYEGMLLINQRL